MTKHMYDWRVWVCSIILSLVWWGMFSTEIALVWEYYWAVYEGVLMTINQGG